MKKYLYWPNGRNDFSVEVEIIDDFIGKGRKKYFIIEPTAQGIKDADYNGFIFDPDGEIVEMDELEEIQPSKRIKKESKKNKLAISLLKEKIEKLSGKKVMFEDKSIDFDESVKTEFITKAEAVQKQLKILGKDIKQLKETKQLLFQTKTVNKNTLKEIKEKTISLEEIRKSLFIQKENYLFKESLLNNLDKVIQNIFVSINKNLRK